MMTHQHVLRLQEPQFVLLQARVRYSILLYAVNALIESSSIKCPCRAKHH